MGTPHRMMATHAIENGNGSTPASESASAAPEMARNADVALSAAPLQQLLETFDHGLPRPSRRRVLIPIPLYGYNALRKRSQAEVLFSAEVLNHVGETLDGLGEVGQRSCPRPRARYRSRTQCWMCPSSTTWPHRCRALFAALICERMSSHGTSSSIMRSMAVHLADDLVQTPVKVRRIHALPHRIPSPRRARLPKPFRHHSAPGRTAHRRWSSSCYGPPFDDPEHTPCPAYTR